MVAPLAAVTYWPITAASSPPTPRKRWCGSAGEWTSGHPPEQLLGRAVGVAVPVGDAGGQPVEVGMAVQPALRQRQNLGPGPRGPAGRCVGPSVCGDGLDHLVDALAL